MSLMFPTIFALGLKGLGPNTKIGGSMIVMAIIGGAVLDPSDGLDLGKGSQRRVGVFSPSVSVR